MADYNVNMKQWNGGSFDNVLPLAFNSKALEGKSYDDIIQYAQSRDLLLYTGQYTGNGNYSSSISITFPFEPILLLCPSIIPSSGGVTYQNPIINISFINISPVIFRALSSSGSPYTFSVWKSTDGKTVNFNSAFNDSGFIYCYAAIGGYDMGGQIPVGSTYTITSSQSWKVPSTGRWMLELYGGGGSGYEYWQGGSSCQRYDSINLTKGDNIDVIIGAGTTIEYSADGGTTTFGKYSVDGGKKASNISGGAGSGNKGTTGAYVFSYSTRNNSTGTFGNKYGYGTNGAGPDAYKYGASGPGAVYLKYLGE